MLRYKRITDPYPKEYILLSPRRIPLVGTAMNDILYNFNYFGCALLQDKANCPRCNKQLPNDEPIWDFNCEFCSQHLFILCSNCFSKGHVSTTSDDYTQQATLCKCKGWVDKHDNA